MQQSNIDLLRKWYQNSDHDLSLSPAKLISFKEDIGKKFIVSTTCIELSKTFHESQTWCNLVKILNR